MGTKAVRDSIVKEATYFFGQQGFKSTNLRAIAKKARVNVAMISYYFKCKDQLYEECLKEFIAERAQKSQEILQAPKNRVEFEARLFELLKFLTSTYEQDYSLLKILFREMQAEKKKSGSNFHKQRFGPMFGVFQGFFASALKEKIVSSEFTSENLTIIFLGSLSYPILAEHPIAANFGLSLNDEKFQSEYSQQLLKVFIKGVIA